MNHDAQGPNHRHFEIKILNAILCVVSTILFDKKCHSEHKTFVSVWQCDYFGSTNRQTALSMIQFAKAVYYENSLKFSILVKMLHNIFGHNTDYVIYSGVCFAACLPATVLHDLLNDKFLVS